MAFTLPRRRRSPAPQRPAFVRLERLEARDVPAIFTVGSIQNFTAGLLNNNGHVATGDLDNDGNLDLVMSNYGSSKQTAANGGTDDPGNAITVMFGTGSGTFINAVQYSTGGSGSDFVSFVAIADLNADNKLDIVSVQTGTEAAGSAASMTVYLNTGIGTFTKTNTVTGGANATWVGIADVSGDGVNDIAITHLGRESGGTIVQNNVTIYNGNSTAGKANGTFTLSNSYTTDVQFIPTAGTFVDFDNDSDLDLAVTIPNAPPDDVSPQVAGKIGLLTNTLGAFAISTTFPASGGPLPISIVATDLNNDGKKDLLVANAGDPDVNGFYLQFGTGTSAARLLGDGFGNFGGPVGQTTGIKSAFAVAAADFNLDGNADMAVVSYGSPLFTNGALVIYLGNGTGSFTLDNTYTDTSAGLQYLAIGDFDGKANPDIVTAGDVNRIRTYSNSTRPSITTLNASTLNAPSGTNITFTATTSLGGGYTGDPAGNVDFYDGTTKLGSGTLALDSGAMKATFNTPGLGLGAHNITAKYTGNFAASPFTGVSTSAVSVVTITGAANTPPTISGPTDQSITTVGGVAQGFTIGDAETPADSLVITRFSSNPSVIPIANIILSGTGTNRGVQVNGNGVVGTSTITLRVTDGGALFAEHTFVITTTAPNTAPTISIVSNQVLTAGNATGNLDFTVGDAQTPVGSLIVTAVSSNQSIIPNAAITLGGSGANRTVNVQSNTTTGTVTITLTVTDGGSLTNFSTFTVQVNAVPNTNPTISDITEKSTNTGVTAGPFGFIVGDAQTAAGLLTLSGSSSNTLLVPNGNIFFGGSDANRTVLISPAAGQNGTATITITVTDAGGLTANDTFVLTVTAPNTNPTISDITDKSTTTGVTAGPFGFTVGDSQTLPSALTLSASSSNTLLVPNGNIFFGGSDANRTILLSPAAGQNGTSTITVTVTDAGGLTATDTFVLTVVAGNTNPTIGDIGNQIVTAGQTLGPINFIVNDTETGLGALTVTAATSNGAIIPQGNITLGGTTGTRTVTILAPTGVAGSSTITLTVTDGGGLTATDTFLVTVNAANTAPTISDIGTQSVTIGNTLGPISFTVGDSETAAGSLIVTATSSDQNVLTNANITLAGSGATRTITLNPTGLGPTTVTVIVSDGSLTTTDTFTVAVNPPTNVPPTISPIDDRTIFRNTNTGPLAFTVTDPDAGVEDISILLTSSNATLVPPGSMILTGGGGAPFSLTITPAAGQTGTTTITVLAGDGVNVTTETFVLTVIPPTAPGRAREFAIGSDIGGGTVRFFNPNQTERFSVTPFGPAFTGGIRVSSADVTGDDIADLVVASGPGIPGQVKVLHGVTGAVLFDIKPFGDTFVRGIVVTAGDMTNDGRAEIIITAESGGGARVRIFSPNVGGVFNQLADFIALIGGDGVADTKFRGGGRSTVGDFNGDGFGDLGFAAGTGGGPRVAIFDGKTMGSNGSVKLRGDFFAFEPNLRNGTYISAGDMDGDGKAELVAGAGPGGGPRVTIYSGKDLILNQQVKLKDFFAGDVNNRGGIRVSVKNLDSDGQSDLIAGAGPGGGSRVTAYLGQPLLANATTPAPLFDFDAFPGFGGGVYVG